MSVEVDRETAGLEVMEQMFGTELAAKIRNSIGTTSPDFSDYVVRSGFGDVYARPGLSLEQRNLVTISILTTLGLERQLAIHIGASLEVGVEPGEILETIFHVALYAGHPRAVNGFRVAGEVFEAAGVGASA